MKKTVILFLIMISAVLHAEDAKPDFYKQGIACLQERGFAGLEDAIALFDKTLTQNSDHLKAHQAMADSLILRYELSEQKKEAWLKAALSHLHKIVSDSPANAAAYYSLSTTYFDLGDEKKGAAALTKALFCDPKDKEIAVAFFYRLLDEKKIREAAAFVDDTVTKMDDKAEMLDLFGEGFINAQLLEQAKACFKAAFKVAADKNNILMKLGYCYASTGDIANAIDVTEAYIESYPENVPALNNLALYYEKSEQMLKAKVIWKRILEIKSAPAEYKARAKEHLL